MTIHCPFDRFKFGEGIKLNRFLFPTTTTISPPKSIDKVMRPSTIFGAPTGPEPIFPVLAGQPPPLRIDPPITLHEIAPGVVIPRAVPDRPKGGKSYAIRPTTLFPVADYVDDNDPTSSEASDEPGKMYQYLFDTTDSEELERREECYRQRLNFRRHVVYLKPISTSSESSESEASALNTDKSAVEEERLRLIARQQESEPIDVSAWRQDTANAAPIGANSDSDCVSNVDPFSDGDSPLTDYEYDADADGELEGERGILRPWTQKQHIIKEAKRPSTGKKPYQADSSSLHNKAKPTVRVKARPAARVDPFIKAKMGAKKPVLEARSNTSKGRVLSPASPYFSSSESSNNGSDADGEYVPSPEREVKRTKKLTKKKVNSNAENEEFDNVYCVSAPDHKKTRRGAQVL